MESNITKTQNTDYRQLVSKISETFVHGQRKAVHTINACIIETYWEIGRYIVEYEQSGNARAKYGKHLLEQLSKDLSLLHGKGFSLSNIKRMRQFYQAYQISATPSHQLSWSHYIELLKIDDLLERSFYEKQTLIEHWSVAQLIRQKKSSLFLRLAASKDREGVLELAREGQKIVYPVDIIREPYILDFLQIPEPHNISETKIEEHIISQMQMNMYLGYFEKEENNEGDNPPVGIVLTREKDEYVVEYAMHNISSRLFVSKYQLYLPTKEDLKRILEKNE